MVVYIFTRINNKGVIKAAWIKQVKRGLNPPDNRREKGVKNEENS